MRPSLRRRALLLTASVAVGLGAGTASAGAATLVVDRDGQQCKNAEFQSISAAVAAAGPGDKVEVCPDLYTESVIVDKPGLRLRAKGSRGRDCFDESLQPADPTRDAIVTGGPTTFAFSLRADDIRVRGFVLEGNNVGIQTRPAFSGHRIRDNLLRRNDNGVFFGASGESESRVTRNCFAGNGSGQTGGAVVAVAALGAGPLRNADIAHNQFFQNTFGIRLGASSQVNVAHNRSLADGTWMRNGGTVDVTVVHNVISRSTSDAIVFFPAGGVAGGTPNTGTVVSHNVLSDNGRDGIQALPGGLLSSVISHNKITDNGRDGIRIESPGNTGNVIEHNHLSANREHDCHDDTVGSGTAGTANAWRHNKAETENRPGLCRRASKSKREKASKSKRAKASAIDRV